MSANNIQYQQITISKMNFKCHLRLRTQRSLPHKHINHSPTFTLIQHQIKSPSMKTKIVLYPVAPPIRAAQYSVVPMALSKNDETN